MLVALSSGCYKTEFFLDTDRLKVTPDGEVSQSSTFFAMIELDEPSMLKTVCPRGVAKLEMEQSFTDGLFHYFTLGFYSPQTTRVWCQRNG